MGDLSELRGLVTAVTFLGALVLIIALIPSGFYTAGESREVNVPDIYESIDIYSFAETSIEYLNDSGGSLWFLDNTYRIKNIDIGNWDIDLYYRRPNEGSYRLFLVHIWYDWIIFPSDHQLEWFSRAGVNRGQVLEISHIESDGAGDYSVSYRALCDHTTYHVTLAYNSSLYNSYTEAWNAGALGFFAGVNWDDMNTGLNAWNLISMLLFFQLPGISPIINALIAIPIWAAIAYLTYILILRAIEALPFT